MINHNVPKLFTEMPDLEWSCKGHAVAENKDLCLTDIWQKKKRVVVGGEHLIKKHRSTQQNT